MLELVVKNKASKEFYDAKANEFRYEFVMSQDEVTLQLEHSLVSISKWESKWHKAFLGNEKKSNEEILDYVKCMTLNTVPSEVYKCLTVDNFKAINDYIQDPMTATNIISLRGRDGGGKNQSITSERIYSWMLSCGIPFAECQTWHLNRLLTLIRLYNLENGSNNKMSRRETLETQAELNKARRAKMKNKG